MLSPAVALLLTVLNPGQSLPHRFTPVQTPQPEPRFEADIRRFEEADKKAMPAPGGVVFVGSSSIVRWATLKTDFPGVNCINRGFGGSETSDSVRYARRIVTKYKPHMVVFFAGTNDLAAGKSAKTVVDDFKKFAGIIQHDLPNAELVYLSVTPAPSRQKLWPAMRQVNEAVAHFCRNGKNMRFVDFYNQFLGPEGEPRPELFVEDQLHMKPKGYEIWVAGLKDIVR